MNETTQEQSGPVYDSRPVMFGANPVGFLLLVAIAPIGAYGLTRLLNATVTTRGLGPFSYNDLWLLCVIAPILLVVLSLGAWWLGNLANRLTIENNRVRHRRGILSKNVREIAIKKIRTVQVHQTPFQRLTNVGLIRIYGTGDKPEIVLGGLPDPNAIKELLNKEEDEVQE